MSDPKTIHVHRLEGCRPTPLAHYLKALGILRLVAEQKDTAARGWWRDDVFHLATKLNRKELETFFLDEYVPTPMTASWLPRSGYSDASSHKKTRKFLDTICIDPSERFGPFREAKDLMVRLAKERSLDIKNAKEMRSGSFVAGVRAEAGKPLRAWIDSCIVFPQDKPSYPAIFGSGGNEGSGSYLANYYIAIVAALIHQLSNVQRSLWNISSENYDLQAFLKAENFNTGHFGESTENDCPWSYILSLEGIIVLTTRLSRRANELLSGRVSGTGASMASPFAVGNNCVGYASNNNDDSKTRQSGAIVSGRGEQLFPLWGMPANLGEIQDLFRTGRVILKPSQAKRSIDFARAVSRAGVSRGITAFERVGYFQRNGDNHMAIPLGRFDVTPRSNQDLLDKVVPWIDGLGRTAGHKLAPNSLQRVHQACEEAVFNCTRNSHEYGFLELLISLGEAENTFLQSSRNEPIVKYARPIPRLSERWLQVIREEKNSSELRLAIALASQRGNLEAKGGWQSVRNHWLPLNKYEDFAKGESGLSIGPEQSSCGLDLQRALIAMMHRRLLACSRGAGWSERDKWNFLPLRLPHSEFGADLEDIQAFLEYRVNDARILAMARGLMAVRFSPGKKSSHNVPEQKSLGGLALYGLLRLAMPVAPIWLPEQADKNVRCTPTVFRRLKNGDLGRAIQVANRQLAATGLRPRISVGIGSSQFAQRLAAAMAFGISSATTTRLALGLTQPEMSSRERQVYEATFAD